MVAISQVASTATAALSILCTTTLLAPGAVVSLGDGLEPLTLTQGAVLVSPCPTLAARDASDTVSALPASAGDSSLSGSSGADDGGDDAPHESNFRDPFYASTFPICYALAATTITSYILVIMLMITPRSFLDGGVMRLSRRSFTNSSPNTISIGGRPILQKVAAITVAASLTLATSKTFSIAHQQYIWGTQNASVLQNEVMNGTELQVFRIISDAFLWLAQAQTLIRLFPRQREKVIIKWAAFVLIILDVVFSAINAFEYTTNGITDSGRPRTFTKPIPALSYLFQLSLEVLYAAWVIYYSLMKKRYAFYHPLMKNICLVAGVSVLSILVPIVFFILDISKPDFAVWGDYVRWVGAAAASVVVWEWVERIEALEREEKKDGILGREVFEGDDVLEVNAASQYACSKGEKARTSGSSGSTGDGGGGNGGGGRTQGGDRRIGFPTGAAWPGVAALASRYRGHDPESRGHHERSHSRGTAEGLRPPLWPSRPAAAVTPTSRTDTPSAASTVYAVRYQGSTEPTPRTPDPPMSLNLADLAPQTSNSRPGTTTQGPRGSPGEHLTPGQNGSAGAPSAPSRSVEVDDGRASQARELRSTPNPQDSSGATGGSEGTRSDHLRTVSEAMIDPEPVRRSREESGRWDIRARLEIFAVNQADKIREKLRPSNDTSNLPVTIIPAPARRGAALQRVLEEEEANAAGSTRRGANSGGNLPRISAAVAGRPGEEQPLRPDQPPLWPGVQPRLMYDDDDDDYLSGTESVALSSEENTQTHAQHDQHQAPPQQGHQEDSSRPSQGS